MAEVTWWLSVSGGTYHGHPTEQYGLLTQKVEMAFLPREGDMVHYLASEEEPEGAIAGYVKRVYWNLDGSAHIEFQEIVVDPLEKIMPQMPDRLTTYWWTDRDGDIFEYIDRSGWVKY